MVCDGEVCVAKGGDDGRGVNPCGGEHGGCVTSHGKEEDGLICLMLW